MGDHWSSKFRRIYVVNVYTDLTSRLCREPLLRTVTGAKRDEGNMAPRIGARELAILTTDP